MSHLAWHTLGFTQIVWKWSGVRSVWVSLLKLLAPQPRSRSVVYSIYSKLYSVFLTKTYFTLLYGWNANGTHIRFYWFPLYSTEPQTYKDNLLLWPLMIRGLDCSFNKLQPVINKTPQYLIHWTRCHLHILVNIAYICIDLEPPHDP